MIRRAGMPMTFSVAGLVPAIQIAAAERHLLFERTAAGAGCLAAGTGGAGHRRPACGAERYGWPRRGASVESLALASVLQREPVRLAAKIVAVRASAPDGWRRGKAPVDGGDRPPTLSSIYARAEGALLTAPTLTAAVRYLFILAAILQITAPYFGLGLFHGSDRKTLWLGFVLGLIAAVSSIYFQDRTLLV